MLGQLSLAIFGRVRCAFVFTLSCAAVMVLWLCASPVAAQSAYFSGVTNALPGSYKNPTGVAVDLSGNVYVSDGGNGTVTEILASNGNVNTIASGLGQPWAVAVDTSENVYVADLNGTVKEILASNGSINTLASGYSLPLGVAVDGSGNVYFADGGTSAVYKIPAGGGTITTVGGGFSVPHGLAVDQNGNIYVTDETNGTVSEMPNTCTSSGCVTSLASGFNTPEGVAVDRSGNVYVSAANGNTLQELVAVGGSILAEPTIVSLGTGFNHPIQVAVNTSGGVFVANYSAPSVLEVMTDAVNLGSVSIGSATPPTASIPFTFTATETLDAPVVLTQGETNKDFTQTATTCSGTITAGDSCTVTVQFAPAAPGLRLGGVQLQNSAGTLLATANIYGIGSGPQIVFLNNSDLTPSVVGSGFSNPFSVAVDGSGDVFVADAGNNAVKEIVAVGGEVSSSSTVNPVGGGFNEPMGVAVDGSGDVFVADFGNSAVKEIVAVNGQVSSSSSVSTVGSGFELPIDVAVDGSGDVFVADYDHSAVKEIVAANGQVSSSSTVNTVGSGFAYPRGLAVDASGDVFVADDAGTLKEIVAVNGQVSSSSTVNTVSSELSSPAGVDLDAAGDVFVADTVNSAVKEFVAVNGQVSSGSTVVTLGWGFTYPTGVAVDARGNVFVGDENFAGESNSGVTEMPLATPPSLTFPSATEEGTTDIADGPLSATVANNGNMTLTFNLPPPTGDNPGLSTSNFTWDDSASTCTQTTPSSSTAFTLVEGASCTVAVDFTPTALGTLTDNLLLTDNTLNGTSATQQIPLSGTAAISAAITSPTPGSTLTSASTTFTWSPGAGNVTYYSVWVGTTPGGYDLANASPTPLTGTSVTVNLPTNGTTIYVRLWTALSDGSFLYNDYTYTEDTIRAATMSIPSPSSTLTSASTTFSWNAAAGNVAYYSVWVGTTPGGYDLANASPTPLTGTSVTVNLPTNGTTIYVRLWTALSGGTFLYNDYTYTEDTIRAATMSIPSPSSTLTSASTTFTWSPGTGNVTYYSVWVGTTPGGYDLANASPTPLTGTSVTVNLPTNGTTIYVRLWTALSDGSFLYNDYTYTEDTIRAATMSIPSPSSTLTSASTTFSWNAAAGNVAYYSVWVGTTPGGYDLANASPTPLTGTSVTVNLPTNGTTIYVRLWTALSGGTFLYNDYTYTEDTQ